MVEVMMINLYRGTRKCDVCGGLVTLYFKAAFATICDKCVAGISEDLAETARLMGLAERSIAEVA